MFSRHFIQIIPGWFCRWSIFVTGLLRGGGGLEARRTLASWHGTPASHSSKQTCWLEQSVNVNNFNLHLILEILFQLIHIVIFNWASQYFSFQISVQGIKILVKPKKNWMFVSFERKVKNVNNWSLIHFCLSLPRHCRVADWWVSYCLWVFFR